MRARSVAHRTVGRQVAPRHDVATHSAGARRSHGRAVVNVERMSLIELAAALKAGAITYEAVAIEYGARKALGLDPDAPHPFASPPLKAAQSAAQGPHNARQGEDR